MSQDEKEQEPAPQKTALVFRVSVRELVAFVLRRGDLIQGHMRAVDPVEGIRGHQKLQKSRPADYRAEVSVRYLYERENMALSIGGRMDGLFEGETPPVIEEIKTTRSLLEDIPESLRELHLGQAKIYAFIYGTEKKLARVAVQLSYFHLDRNRAETLRQTFDMGELTGFFEEVAAEYLAWAQRVHHWLLERNAGLTDFEFPLDVFRPGQRKLAAAVFRTIRRGGQLLAQAPTGIGKTMATLFPALKAFPDGEFEKCFYLTAKNSGNEAAEHCLSLMRARGLKIKSLHLTARDKICFEAPCDPSACPFTRGYYDRLKPALAEIFQKDGFDRDSVLELAREYRLCPFELSMDLASWMDIIVCDFNYVFDPGARLRRFFGEDGGGHLLLVDEAHNLVDRSRSMYSAVLEKRSILAVKKTIGKGSASLSRALNGVNRVFLAIRKQIFPETLTPTSAAELPDKLIQALHHLAGQLEVWFDDPRFQELSASVREFYFDLRRFLRIADLFDANFRLIYRSDGSNLEITLFCIDAAEFLQKILTKQRAGVFFSATLTPFPFYARLFGCGETVRSLNLASPFDPDRVAVLVLHHVETRYRQRAASYETLAGLVERMVRARKGNYLIYFPSYAYMREVHRHFTALNVPASVLMQQPAMSAEHRRRFLDRFHEENEQAVVGFAVMGGVFGEGVDLVGERLIGVMVVGVGLPGLCLERDLIKRHADQKNSGGSMLDGFDLAYRIPGMNRVMQTAGRLIRGERDRGVICLVDRRFGYSPYPAWYPPQWRTKFLDNDEAFSRELALFWERWDS